MESAPFELTPKQKGLLESLTRETGMSVASLIAKVLERLQEDIHPYHVNGETNSGDAHASAVLLQESRSHSQRVRCETDLRPDGNGWRGDVQVGDGRRIPIQVLLPDGFPDQLPIVEVDRNSLPRRVPHIEKAGKSCLAPSSGILLDIENPEGLVRDALEIARRTLQEGLAGILDDDFHNEFLAYWNPSDTYLTDCDVLAQTRDVELMLMDRAGRGENSVRKLVLADTLERGQQLIKLLGGTLKGRRTAFFLSLDTSIPAPDFDEVITVREAMQMIRGVCGENSWRALHKRLNRPVLPAIILLSIPSCESRILVAVQFEEVSSAARRKAVHSFRSSNLPAWRALQFAQQQSVKRIGTERYDPAFLLPRGGAMDSLQNKPSP